MFRLGLVLLTTTLAAAAERQFEIHGQIEPPSRASVIIDGATTPFTASTFAGSNGRFRFRKLEAGSYTITVFVPGLGEARRTVAVSPSLADSKGRVAVTMALGSGESAGAKALERSATVSVRQLSIPDRARSEYNEARKKLARRDVEGAVRHLERAVELAPQFAAAWNYLGVIAYQSMEHEKAEAHFRRALEQEPGFYSSVVNLGGVLNNLGKHQEALKYNLYAVQEQPEDALANSQLGITYFSLGDFDKALQYLDAAKRLDPSHFSHPQLILAEIYMRRAQPAAAIRELEDFLARHPDAPNASAVREQVEHLRSR